MLCYYHLSVNLCLLLLIFIGSSEVILVSSASVPVQSSIFRNLARGSALKMAADLSGGLPLEVWKSSVVLEHIQASQDKRKPAGDGTVLKQIWQERGVRGMWLGCSPRMVEGFFCGAVLLAAKETLRKTLTASPLPLSPAVIGFLAGAGGGAAQAIVMAPCSMLVTAAANGQSPSAAAKEVWDRQGPSGIYKGAPAVAARQATNWASRQGFTELIRPRIGVAGVPGEIIAGCLGGFFACWNTPFEVARIEAQRTMFSADRQEDRTLFQTMNDVVEKRGFAGLYTGLLPRAIQSCYQTIFLVCVPRLLDA